MPPKQSALSERQQQRLVMIVSSATAYHRSEHVAIEAVIVPKLKLSNIERHELDAHFVERPDNATCEDRSKAFNRIGVIRASVKSEAMAA
jgi:hypothetical protein